ncbi:hypothetical protein Scep_009697 [Stephania cephalantha]|uniref:Uncharacterized protein n=1 Tax=Stephania cephalantha TaxID=152367 RepID=A0AAP0JTM1_9MAGN
MIMVTLPMKNPFHLTLHADAKRAANDVDEGSGAHASNVQWRELSVHKTPMPQAESFSSDSNEEDREQAIHEEDSTEQESEEENASKDGDEEDESDKNEEGESEEQEEEGKKEKEEDEYEDEDEVEDVYEQMVKERGPRAKGLSSKAKASTAGCGCPGSLEGVAPSEGDMASALKMADEVLKHLTVIDASGPSGTPTSGATSPNFQAIRETVVSQGTKERRQQHPNSQPRSSRIEPYFLYAICY